MFCIRLRFDPSQAVPSSVPAPDFQSGGAGFQTRENALSANDRALALVRTPRTAQSAPALISSPRSDALYQGTTTKRELGYLAAASISP